MSCFLFLPFFLIYLSVSTHNPSFISIVVYVCVFVYRTINLNNVDFIRSVSCSSGKLNYLEESAEGKETEKRNFSMAKKNA